MKDLISKQDQSANLKDRAQKPKTIGIIGCLSGIGLSILLLFIVLMFSGFAVVPSDIQNINNLIQIGVFVLLLNVLACWAAKRIFKSLFYSAFLVIVGVLDILLLIIPTLFSFFVIIPLVCSVWAGILGIIRNPKLKTEPENLPAMLGIIGGVLGISIVFLDLWENLHLGNDFFHQTMSSYGQWLIYSILGLIGGFLLRKRKLKIGGFLVLLAGILGFFQLSFSPGRIIVIHYGWILPALFFLFSMAFAWDSKYINKAKLKNFGY